ncbi:hypothetical protein ACFOEE_08220 [Pseudoalteromonas fenneropenaei]|uniref:Uncharacterized protein n=1 Tax=Pseudoalteromonas fenneropenaei TaxID=1737459 RepID=A0ABV7CIN9_9GAMM
MAVFTKIETLQLIYPPKFKTMTLMRLPINWNQWRSQNKKRYSEEQIIKAIKKSGLERHAGGTAASEEPA